MINTLVAIGVDIYGTLVDPHEVSLHLRPLVGDLSEKMARHTYERELEGTRSRSGEDWCWGFLTGVSLASESWRRRDSVGRELGY
jgi:uncharacterized protein UPF0149